MDRRTFFSSLLGFFIARFAPSPFMSLAQREQGDCDEFYIADVGWMRDSGQNGVFLTNTVKDALRYMLNGQMLYDRPYRGSLRKAIGYIIVEDGGNIYCYTEQDLTGLKPALQITAKVQEQSDGSKLVTEVKTCSLFTTRDDVDGEFYYCRKVRGD